MGTQSITNPEMDKGFEIDETNYHKKGFSMRRIKHKAVCNKCNSEDCSIIKVVQKITH